MRDFIASKKEATFVAVTVVNKVVRPLKKRKDCTVLSDLYLVNITKLIRHHNIEGEILVGIGNQENILSQMQEEEKVHFVSDV